MERVLTVLADKGGFARRTDFARADIGRREVDRAVDGGGILRIRKGVFALPGLRRENIVAAQHGGALACGDALREHGVWVLDDRDVAAAGAEVGPHVWIGPSGRAHGHPGCRCRVHHEQWEGRPAPGVVSVTLALLQFAACASRERFFASLESAMHLGLISESGLRMLRTRLPRAMRWIVDLARSDSESGLESLLRFRLHLLGITLQPQVVIAGVGRVDFLLAGRLILEVDGRENHDGPSLRHKDLLRDAAAAAQGLETLRFDYAMVVYEWDLVLAAILGRLRIISPDVAQEAMDVLQELTGSARA